MKVLMKPIKMIQYTDFEGKIDPIRFQMLNEQKELITVKISNVADRSEERHAGNKMLIFRCESEIDGVLKVYELKYELLTCKWFVWKM